jgi:acetyl-CoA carboxylase biotin carboxyl carrier protein
MTMDKSISRAQELAKIGREHELAEMEYEDADVKIRLQFEAPPVSIHQQSFDPALLATLSAPQPAAAPAIAAASAPSAPWQGGETVKSPLAGVFYAASRPDADPFVKEQDTVAEGQTLCIVEAMKLMNEIAADRACKITKILVENAEAVEEGQPLFIIE